MVEKPRFEERTARFLRPWALRWDYPVNPETFFTPLRECIALKTGRPIDAAALHKLKQHGLAHALVVEPMEHEQWPNINIAALGIVSVARAEQMQREGKALDWLDVRDTPKLASRPTLGEVLDLFSTEPAALLVEVDRREGDGTLTAYAYRGVVTVADLSRAGFRDVLFRILADLEMGLARLLFDADARPATWIEDANLPDLLNAVSADGLWSALAATRDTFDSHKEPIRLFRNTTMHPVRRLVTSTGDVARLKQQIELVLDLTLKLVQLGKVEQPRTIEGQLALHLISTKPSR
jgi:hypothetical protein